MLNNKKISYLDNTLPVSLKIIYSASFLENKAIVYFKILHVISKKYIENNLIV